MQVNDTPRENRLIPALLDRLTDHKPQEKTEAVNTRMMDKGTYRASVLRDITWLLNTINAESHIDFSEHPRAQASVLNFGVLALSGQQLVDDDRAMIKRAITKALLAYEPRILPDSLAVKVMPMDDTYAANNQVALEIKGQLWSEPYPLDFLLRTHIDLENGQVQLSDAYGVYS
ncbi:type VI secretion system baseplate subunit TssE [Gilvimarinus japonicus]|uniref:Type VI secretion system baseplate subunit TssE n=1 Tax=Gilvimarinus japonicus TaxID=1796469 RepID=A0ABV7HRA2_9GAMM